MAASLLATGTVLVAERSGWTMFSVMVWRETLQTADMMAGEIAVVHTPMMYPSHALQVSLLGRQFTFSDVVNMFITGFQCARKLCSRLRCRSESVLTAQCSRLPLRTLRACCLCFRSSASQISLDRPVTSFQIGASLLRDHLCRTVFLLLYGDQR